MLMSVFMMDKYFEGKTINAVFRAGDSTREFKKKKFLHSYDLIIDTFCCCLWPYRSRRIRRIREQASRRIDRELDVTFFLRKQIVLNKIIKEMALSRVWQEKARKKLIIKEFSSSDGDSTDYEKTLFGIEEPDAPTIREKALDWVFQSDKQIN